MCCRHVVDAASPEASTIGAADPGAVVSFRGDLLDDSSTMLDVVLCRECANQFGRTSGEVLSGRHFDDTTALPWICPFCSLCLSRWTGHDGLGRSGPAPKSG
jgi:hypothetical protein